MSQTTNELKLIAEVFRRANPDVKDTTLKQYITTIRKFMYEVNIMIEPEDREQAYKFEWVADSDKVINEIENSSRTPNTRRTLYGYLKQFTKGLSNDYVSLPEFKLYGEKHTEYIDKVKETREKNKEETGMPLTDKQKDNLIEKNDIEIFMKTLTNQVKLIYANKKINNEDELGALTIYILLNTYLRFPFRNELYNLQYTTEKKSINKTGNYLIRMPDKSLILNRVEYKTAAIYGEKRDPFPPELTKMYNKYLKIIKPNKANPYMFPYIMKYDKERVIKTGDKAGTIVKGNPQQEYSRFITNKFNEQTGKKVGSTILMKVINQLSEEEKGVVELLKNLSMKRGTSIPALLEYYL